jgi:hypothetical protein
LGLAVNKMPLRFGAYEIEAQLGSGGVTETHRARKGAQVVALKVLRADRGGQDGRIASAFKALARRNQGLKNVAGLAPVLDVATGPLEAFIATELIEGVDLEGLWDNATAAGDGLDPELVGSLGCQIARVLAKLHDRRGPIVHGGLCPGNVIVRPDGRAILTDVGYSAALRTMTEFAPDKWWYAAPELLEGSSTPTVSSDLYSLGAILYYLLAGEAPYMGESREELLAQFSDQTPEVPGLPDWLGEALRTLLAKDPDDRPGSAASAALALTPPPSGGERIGALVTGRTPIQGVPVTFARPAAPIAAAKAPVPASAPAPAPSPAPSPPVLAAPLPPAMPAAAKAPPPAVAVPPLDLMPAWGANGPDGISLGLTAEPQWVDAPVASTGSALDEGPLLDLPGESIRQQASVDDILDLPPAHAHHSNAAQQGTLDRLQLPELEALDGSVEAPLVTDAPAARFVRPSMSDETAVLDRRVALDVDDPNQVGMVEYDADPDAEKVPGTGTISLPLPRRAGSARVGAAAAARRPRPLLFATVGFVVLGLCGFIIKETFLKQPIVLPPPAKEDPLEAKAAKAAQPVAKAAEDLSVARGELTVMTSPKGATVWIDGEEKGKTPMTLKTTPGAHRLVMTKPGFRMLREVADTSEGLTIKRTLPAASINMGGTVVLQVDCDTKGKFPVFVDGKDTGLLCPVDNLKIPAGNRLIGVYVVPQNKIWSFEREVVAGSKPHKVVFSY